MGGIYVTYVADLDNGHRHVVTLVWPFKSTFQTGSWSAFDNAMSDLVVSSD